ncbi:MAG: ribosome silencing factor [Bacillota bacterium]
MTAGPDDRSRELANLAVKLAAEKKIKDMRLLEVGRVSIIADYFLIGTGSTAVQVHAICDHLIESLKKEGFYASRVEGYQEGWWVILDYGPLVIHIFQPEARDFYDLERLWSESPLVELESTGNKHSASSQ